MATYRLTALALGVGLLLGAAVVGYALPFAASQSSMATVQAYLAFGLALSGVLLWIIAGKGVLALGAPAVVEHGRIDEAIHRGKQEWEATVDAVSDLIILTDNEGKIIRCNQSTIQCMQTTYRDLLGRSIWEVLWGNTQSAPRSLSGKMSFPRIEGWFDTSSYPVYLRHQPHGTVYVFKNLREMSGAVAGAA